MCPVSKRHMPCLPECGNQIRCYEPIGNPYQAARILFDQRLRMNHRRHLDDSKALRPAQQIITQSPISLICNALQAVRRRNRSKSGRVDRSQPAIPCRCTYKRLNVEIYGSRPTKRRRVLMYGCMRFSHCPSELSPKFMWISHFLFLLRMFIMTRYISAYLTVLRARVRRPLRSRTSSITRASPLQDTRDDIADHAR
jgi:hypothetical protein